MPFFIITMSHLEGDGWNRYLSARVADLKDLVAVGIGSLMVSEWGALFGTVPAESSRHLPGLPTLLLQEV